MTNKEAIKYLIVPFATSTKSYNEYLKQKEAYELAIKALEERPQGDCENCNFRKFTETFVGGVVEAINKNDIAGIEQLSEMLKGGAE